MSTLVLARKWRPKNFSTVVGQEHVVRALSNALERQRLHHAYLFTGTRGVGKTTLARILAKALNCETGITPTPCGSCRVCVEIDQGRHVDLMEVDAATNTRVEEMRELLDSAQYMPAAGRFKVYIIDEVHMLSKSAFNSMLKTLEEPPEHVKFILATTDPQKVPVTVLSRCLQFNLKQMPPEAIVGHLESVLNAEQVPFEPRALGLLARAAEGSMRDSLSLLDQAIAHGAGRIEAATVSAMLGAIDQEYLFNILHRLAADDRPGVFDELRRMEQLSVSFDRALQELASILSRVAIAQLVPEALNEQIDNRERVLELAHALSPQAVQLYYQIAINGRRDLPLAPDESAGFGMVLMRMMAFSPELDAAAESAARPAAARGAPQPASAAKAAPSPAASAADTGTASAFDGDWPKLAAGLALTGMAQMLARHCELQNYDGARMELCVAPEHKHLLEKTFQEKLAAALRARLGAQLRVSFAPGERGGATLAAIEDRAQQELQGVAIQAIERDPFVRELIDQLDAKLIESSIRPAQ